MASHTPKSQQNFYFKFLMPRPLQWGILGAHPIILFKDIYENARKQLFIDIWMFWIPCTSILAMSQFWQNGTFEPTHGRHGIQLFLGLKTFLKCYENDIYKKDDLGQKIGKRRYHYFQNWHFYTFDGFLIFFQKALICVGVFSFEIVALREKLGC